MKKIILSAIPCLFAFTLFAQIPVNGLLAYYPFSGNANDLSGNSNNGVVNGATLVNDRFGNANSAYLFVKGGTQQYIQCPQLALQNTSFSVVVWAKWVAQTTGLGDDITGQGTASNLKGFQFSYNYNDGVYFDFYNFGLTSPNTGFYKDQNWHQIIGVYDTLSGLPKIYVDGVLTATGVSIPAFTGSGSFFIGRGCYNTSTNFSGILDDIRVYGRVLTTTEISSLYGEGICKQTVSVADTLRITTITGLNSIPSNFGVVKIYPNPANDVLNISVSNPSGNYTLKILNSSSQTVYSGVLSNPISQVNLSNIGTSGMYFIQILDLNSNILETKKLILE